MMGHTYPFTTVKPSKLDEAFAKAHGANTPQPDVDFGFNLYQEKAHETAIYPKAAALQYLSTGLAGEVGEFCSKVAKAYRKDAPLATADAAAELGDILWFVAELAGWLGYDLADIATDNLNKLRSRQERGQLQGNGDNR